MIRPLWFLLQAALIVSAGLWLAAQPGDVVLTWMDYRLSVPLGVFLLLLTLVVLAFLVIHRMAIALVSLPSLWRRVRNRRAQNRGLNFLVRGFAALAAGDAQTATRYARQTKPLLPAGYGLAVLLEAQAARLRGEDTKARECFKQLLLDKDAAFFGVRGLLKTALENGHDLEALDYARRALEAHPRQGWVLKTVYDLEIRLRHWDRALAILAPAKKHGALSQEKALSDEVAIWLHLADEDLLRHRPEQALKKLHKAWRLDPVFAPAVVRYASLCLERNKRRKALVMVEKAWKAQPHPELLALWDRLMPKAGKKAGKKYKKDMMRRLRWYERLADLNPGSARAQLALARAAMDEALWGEAKNYLDKAQALRADAALFRLRAELEEKTSRDMTTVRNWLEKAAAAPPDKVWVCTQTGIIYDRWAPVAAPHDAFNTMIWDYPQGRKDFESLVAESNPDWANITARAKAKTKDNKIPDPLLIDSAA